MSFASKIWLGFVLLALGYAPFCQAAIYEQEAENNSSQSLPNIHDLQDYLSDQYGVELYGFLEVRNGWRTQNDPYEKEASLAEARVQLDLNKDFGWAIFKVKSDLLGDLVTDEVAINLREANMIVTPLDFLDIKAGRQILTWGTGDLLFINDLFPKDWESFFIGRDDEYLKAPSDAVKLSFFGDIFNMDFVYTPIFNGSRYIDGERLSYWNGVLQRRAGRDFIFDDHERNSFGNDSEYAVRISKTLGGNEYALYGYDGFWKTPEGLDPVDNKLIYPRLSAYGASVRGTVFGGIGNIEIGYYDSRDDRSGTDPTIRNSEIRLLAGFVHELGRDFTGGIQYYFERMADHDQYRLSLAPGTPEADRYRHLFTVRLTKMLMQQNLTLSFFAYYSPSDQDAYLRPKLHYKLTDRWSAEVGGNIFLGAYDHTFFGQFEKNTNIYAGLRVGF